MLRLDLYPPPVRQEQATLPPFLSCLLHSGELPSDHHLAVWIGGISQPLIQEDQQEVFTWQCAIETEMEIQLLHRRQVRKAWRGWWKGENRLVHGGTLRLPVFFAGTPQPPETTPAVFAPRQEPETATPLVLIESTVSSPTTGVTSSPIDLAPHLMRVPQEGDLWDEETPRSENRDKPAESVLVASQEEELEQGQGIESQEKVLSSQEQEHPPVLPTAPEGTVIASFPATLAWSDSEHDRKITELATLLAGLPDATILVDLRKHAPTPRSTGRRTAPRSPQARGLTKELLRSRYGARYWERGQVIGTTSHYRTDGSFQRIVTVTHPETLHELIKALTQGFSLLLLDNVVTYRESARAAVLTALLERVSHLQQGPCS